MLHTDQNKAWTLRQQAPYYVLYKDGCTKDSFLRPFLNICMAKVDYALREVHERICGNDLGDSFLAYKVLHHGIIGRPYNRMQSSS